MKSLILNSRKQWKGILFFVFLLVLNACSTSEEDTLGTIRGRVISTLDKEPQQGVSVTLTPGGKSTITGSDGYFEFNELTPGQYSLQAQKSEFSTNYKQITVVAGEVASGDLSLTPKQTTSSVEVSPTILDFGTATTEMLFSIRNTGNIGTIDWTISGISVNWLQVSPAGGSKGQGMTSTVRVIIDRMMLTSESTSYITVNYPGGSTSIRVSASPNN